MVTRCVHWMCFALFAAALTPTIDAEVMATSGPIPPESIGLPPEPPFVPLLGIVNPGKFATDPSIPPKGRAFSEVFYEELRGMTTPAGPADEVEASVRTKFDELGRVTEQVEKRWGSETDTLYTYQDYRLVGMESTYPNAKNASPKFWSYWKYDSGGKLTDYRRGRGSKIENHELGFHYDNQGRLLGYEYRQGADDQFFSRTNISYSSDGRTITVTQVFAGGKIIDRSTRTLDDHRRVVRVVPESEGRPTPEQAKNVVFQYDEKGRLVAQTTDVTKFGGSGSEFDLPPGTISIAYDDQAHTKITRYSVPNEGTIEVVVTQDENGATLGYALRNGPQQVSSKLECEYDSLGNWTSCRQITGKNGQNYVKERFRRTITYR